LRIDDVFLDASTRESLLPGFFNYWNEHNTGYMLMDASLGYSLAKHYRISFMVKNLTNTEYMGRPGDIQPHRNFSLRISGSF
jgi:outer membrane receptor protein involved in Fe transport